MASAIMSNQITEKIGTHTANIAKDSDAIDEMTNSSILEFLNQEENCRDISDYDNTSEVDIESIFEEINRLSDNNDDRSMEEILKEAELLLTNQPILELSNTTKVKSIKNSKEDTSIILKCQSKELSPVDRSQHSIKSNDTVDNKKEMTKVPSTMTEKMSQDNKSENNKLETTLNFDDIVVPAQAKKLALLPKNTTSKSQKYPLLLEYTEDADATININLQNNETLTIRRKSLPKVAPKIISNESTVMKMSNKSTATEHSSSDKSTSSSPTRVQTPINNLYSWSKERALEKELQSLQEKLKDTEERFQSLRLQYDSLSSHHRTLRDTHSTLLEEMEKLKLDIQHLNECANVLRNELQSARSDRSEAIELQKLLQIELDENRGDKKKFLEQTEKDAKLILDLQRQCKEMERILMRKHPDSVSALIVASKNTNALEDKSSSPSSSSRRLLEQRIAQLESDAKEQDAKAQKILSNVQARFSSVQSKYETHIADLETQVLSLQEINTKLNHKIESQSAIIRERDRCLIKSSNYTQTDEISEKKEISLNSIAIQTEFKSMTNSNNNNNSKSPQPINSKKQSKIPNSYSESQIGHPNSNNNNGDAHLLATIRGMRVDLAIKEKALQRLTRDLEDCKKTIKKLQKEKELLAAKSHDKQSSAQSSRKPYDPTHFTENNSDLVTLKETQNKIKLLEFDYKSLHDKRLQDLKTLQAAHERELATCHDTVQILQQRLAERDESVTMQKRRRVPVDYYALKAKVTSLERRHSEREKRLHMLVEALSKGRLINGALDDVLAVNNVNDDCSRCHQHANNHENDVH